MIITIEIKEKKHNGESGIETKVSSTGLVTRMEKEQAMRVFDAINALPKSVVIKHEARCTPVGNG